MSDTIESLRAKMRASKDPRQTYQIAKQIIALRRAAEASGHAGPKPPVQPIKPKQDPVSAYREAKARIAAKGGTPSEPAPSTPPTHKHTLGVRDWQTEPPEHLRQAVEAARRHQ